MEEHHSRSELESHAILHELVNEYGGLVGFSVGANSVALDFNTFEGEKAVYFRLFITAYEDGLVTDIERKDD